MVSNAPIFTEDQVFNTYGENLTNAQLLVQYGFSLDGNENDCISWDLDELFSIATLAEIGVGTASSVGRINADDSARLKEVFLEAIGRLNGVENLALDETNLIYNPWTATGRGGELLERDSGQNRRLVFCLNSDGKLSRDLWVYCALLGHIVGNAADLNIEGFVTMLREASLLLWRLEGSDGAWDNDRGNEWSSRQLAIKPSIPLSYAIHTVVCLCHSRRTDIGKRDLPNASDVGEVLDVSRGLFSSFFNLDGLMYTRKFRCT